MSKHAPIEGSRLLGTGTVKWRWLLPWACHSCQRYGAVEVNVEMTRVSTDDEVNEKIDRAHFEASRFCISRRFQRGTRIYRLKNGTEKIYLRRPGEEEWQVTPEPWPPWRQE